MSHYLIIWRSFILQIDYKKRRPTETNPSVHWFNRWEDGKIWSAHFWLGWCSILGWATHRPFLTQVNSSIDSFEYLIDGRWLSDRCRAVRSGGDASTFQGIELNWMIHRKLMLIFHWIEIDGTVALSHGWTECGPPEAYGTGKRKLLLSILLLLHWF